MKTRAYWQMYLTTCQYNIKKMSTAFAYLENTTRLERERENTEIPAEGF